MNLKPFYANVKSGDTDNREGIAAKIYWTQLFGKDFKRDRCGDSPNVLLNYGYSILRAATARALLGSGLLPNLGIFHKPKSVIRKNRFHFVLKKNKRCILC